MKRYLFLEEKHTYKANLQRVGSLIPETITILSQYNRVGNWQLVRRQVLNENLIGKGSVRTLEGILNSIYSRYVVQRPPLPTFDLLANFVDKDIAKIAKSQALFAYICASDSLVRNLLRYLTKIKYSPADFEISKEFVLEFIDYQVKFHLELGHWSDYLKKKWSRSFIALLRNFGFMEKTPRYRINTPIMRVHSFFFLLLGIIQSGYSAREALTHEIWSCFFQTSKSLEQLTLESQSFGWLRYSKIDDMIELQITNSSMEEWLHELE